MTTQEQQAKRWWLRSGGIAEALLADLERYWPTLDDISAGEDIMDEPVAGLPDNETLAALCCDANLTGEVE